MTSLTNRRHWSYSALSQYLRCPLQFYFERVLKLPRTSISGSLILGSATHEALAFYHEHLKHGEIAEHSAVHHAFRQCWEQREAANHVVYKADERREQLLDQGLSLIDLYLSEPPPQNIVAVEKTMMIPMQNSKGDFLEAPLVAVVDLITAGSDGLRVTELKTSGRAYGQFEIDSSLQPACYVSAVWQSLGIWATVEYVVMIKTKTPKTQRISTVRTLANLGRLGDLIETVERAIEADVFYPIESPLNCSSCSFRRECKLWKPSSTPNQNLPSEMEAIPCQCSQS